MFKIIRQTFRHARKMEVMGFVVTMLGIAGCICAAAIGVPGLISASLLCIAGVVVFIMG